MQIPITSRLVQHLQHQTKHTENNTCQKIINTNHTDNEKEPGNKDTKQSKLNVKDKMQQNCGHVSVGQKRQCVYWSAEDKIDMLCRALFPFAFMVSILMLLVI